MTNLSNKKIPKELWHQKMLHMPECVVNSYRKLLEAHDAMDMATSTNNFGGPIGGRSRKKTLEHFAKRYGVSSCRVESLVIDPMLAYDSIPNDLIITFSDGVVSLLDAPCGTGSAGTSLLSTIAVLRASGLIPKLPLTVMITGGDFSQTALDIYSEMLKCLETSLGSVGITVRFSPLLWNAEKANTTAALVDNWFANSEVSEEFLAIIANFSGEAGKSFSNFERSFQHIHERLYDKVSSILWVEPAMKGAISYFDKVKKIMSQNISWFKTSKEGKYAYECEYNWFHPFQQRSLPCKVLVQKYVRL